MTKKNLPGKRSAFLEKVKQSKAVQKPVKKDQLTQRLTPGVPRLLFTLDATASREGAWNVARKITQSMFEQLPGELEVSLGWHGGGYLQEITPFSANSRGFLDKLNAVTCHAGQTALNELLQEAVQIPRVKAMVYIGDAYEEYEEDAYALAEQLKIKGVKLFMFHDRSSARYGYDVDSARVVFGKLVDICGGCLLDFNEDAPQSSKDLLNAIAVYAVGGVKALEKQHYQLPGARLLLDEL